MISEDNKDSTFGRKDVQGFTDKTKLPKTPDFSSVMVEMETAKNPILLDDFSGSNAYRANKP